MDKVEAHKRELQEYPIDSAEANNRMRNVPSGPLADRWTGETLTCPACGLAGLDKFTGGPDIHKGEINRTEFIYHCRVCDLDLTEEEYRQI